MTASILTLWPAVLAVLAVLDGPVVPQMCVNDEVQARTRTIQAPAWGPAASSGREEAPPHHLSGQKMEKSSSRRRRVPQPIRIHSWISWESSGLSEAERRMVEMAVKEAVGKVSELLSGEVDRYTLSLSHTHTVFVSI